MSAISNTDLYRKAVCRARGDFLAEHLAINAGDLARLALKREDWPAAEALARRALRFFEKTRRPTVIALYSRILAKALARQGKGAEGLPYARRAVDVFSRLCHFDIKAARDALRECEG